MNKNFKARVINNSALNFKTYILEIEPLEKTIVPSPGQFYMLQPNSSFDPLLKRPFSYLRKKADRIQFLYAVRGKGTGLMKNFQQDKIISLTGPFGNGYPAHDNNQIPLLIAGGTGIASIFSLYCELAKKYLIYGAKTRDELVLIDEIEKSGGEFFICTNDCSYGKKGMVDELFKDFLISHQDIIGSLVIYACGPKPMLKSISKIASENNIRGFASLEENMACGFGACLGCAVKTKKGYQRVCKEGTVFPFEEIVW